MDACLDMYMYSTCTVVCYSALAAALLETEIIETLNSHTDILNSVNDTYNPVDGKTNIALLVFNF